MVDIRRLDEATVERIAAGEVVERPASVVKELVENSLDADAARVEVSVERGGKDGITVADDGIGMTAEEVRRAVEEHTTSKIRDIDDLESGVGTLGFRGEALHAIGAVSRLTITTRPRADRDVDDPLVTELTVEGGEVTSVEPAGCPEGTTIEVEDLFFNVPARRKYLKQDGTEFAHVNTVVTSYALANPGVAVSLSHDGRETLATTGAGDRREAVMSVYGREVAEAMVEVDAREGADGESADLPDGPLGAVTGLVSHPETTRASREYVSTYVNGRYVTASTVRDAAVDAYGSQLAPDRYPFAVLFLDIPAGNVDVNVHPRKLDVRFADEESVRDQIRTAVEDGLLDAGLLRSSAPRGKSAPDQTEIAPERDHSVDDERRDETGIDDERDDDGADHPTDSPDTEAAGNNHGGTAGDVDTRADDGPGAGTGDRRSRGGVSTARSDAGDETSPTRPDTGDDARNGETDRERVTDTDRHEDGATRKFSGGHEQERLGDDPDLGESFESLPSMRVLGQVQDTYVAAETADGLVLIDQHAADERVNYERLRDAFAGDVTTQALAEPVELSLTAREAELFEQYESALATLGFRAERAGERTVTIRTVPSLVAEAADPDLLRDALGAFVRGEGAAAETVEAAADELLADLACYPSVTGNTPLSEGSIRELLAALDECENPWACPHGRPVIVEFDAEEIDARFERDYPGHGGRRD
jgi:DNA mismatch repair protein MutL